MATAVPLLWPSAGCSISRLSRCGILRLSNRCFVAGSAEAETSLRLMPIPRRAAPTRCSRSSRPVAATAHICLSSPIPHCSADEKSGFLPMCVEFVLLHAAVILAGKPPSRNSSNQTLPNLGRPDRMPCNCQAFDGALDRQTQPLQLAIGGQGLGDVTECRASSGHSSSSLAPHPPKAKRRLDKLCNRVPSGAQSQQHGRRLFRVENARPEECLSGEQPTRQPESHRPPATRLTLFWPVNFCLCCCQALRSC